MVVAAAANPFICIEIDCDGVQRTRQGAEGNSLKFDLKLDGGNDVAKGI